jgi:hypothetical protein
MDFRKLASACHVQSLRRVSQVVAADDVVALEGAARLVTAQLHRERASGRGLRDSSRKKNVARDFDLRIDSNPHQTDAVIFALRRLREGGCILADEVGLGKTIEAGLVIAQSRAEGAERLLLIVPKSLIGQWQDELLNLFGIQAREDQSNFSHRARTLPEGLVQLDRDLADLVDGYLASRARFRPLGAAAPVRDPPEKHPRHQMPAFSHVLRQGVLRLEHGMQTRREGEDPPLVILHSVGVQTDFPPGEIDTGATRDRSLARPMSYLNTGMGGTMVEASSDGVVFALTAASFPAGVSRSIVTLPDGRFRMYYFPDGTSFDVRSAVSNNGLNWTVEDGTRYSDPSIGAARAMVLPTGGYRLYCPNGTGISSAMSSDGLTFGAEGPLMIPPPDSTSTWGPSAAAYVKGQFHMVLTKVAVLRDYGALILRGSISGVSQAAAT